MQGLSYRFFLTVFVVGVLVGCGSGRSDNTSVSPVESATRDLSSSELAQSLSMVVYKDANCGCCGLWVEHMQQAGFDMAVENTTQMHVMKQQLGIQPEVQSCHTLVDQSSGYVFEGHIPANIIQRFLANPPGDARGLAVPGMPIGSPGMEMEDRFMPYAVLLLKTDGSREVYAQVNTQQEQY